MGGRSWMAMARLVCYRYWCRCGWRCCVVAPVLLAWRGSLYMAVRVAPWRDSETRVRSMGILALWCDGGRSWMAMAMAGRCTIRIGVRRCCVVVPVLLAWRGSLYMAVRVAMAMPVMVAVRVTLCAIDERENLWRPGPVCGQNC